MTKKDIEGLNLKTGPALIAMNSCWSISKIKISASPDGAEQKFVRIIHLLAHGWFSYKAEQQNNTTELKIYQYLKLLFIILNGIRSEYLALGTVISPDQCFLTIIDKVIRKTIESSNYTPIPEEELRLCVQILVVDAFIRCKIFKNPVGSTDAHS